jgi:hypothetical protein
MTDARWAAPSLALLLAASALGQEGPPEGYERVATDAIVIDRRPANAGLAAQASELFASSLAAVEERLGARLGKPAPLLVLAPNEAELRARVLALGGPRPPDWALAIALPPRRALVLRCDRLVQGENFLEPTLRHELAHLVLGEVARRSGERIPRWLDEGLAQYAERAVLTREQELELGAAARFGTLEPFSSLERDFPPHAREAQRAYEMSLGFVLWLDRKPGGVRALVARLEAGASADEAIRSVAGEPRGEAAAEWALELAAKSSIVESLVRSSAFWWGALALLAVVAFARHAVVTRRLKRQMERRERLEDAPPPPDARPPDSPPPDSPPRV